MITLREDFEIQRGRPLPPKKRLLMTSSSPAGPGPCDDEHRQVRRGEPGAAAAVAAMQRPGALRRA
jgi:hypothetical protein